QALFDKGEFGTWFGVRFPAGTFAAGETVRGNITYPGYEHVVMEIEVVEVVAGQRFVYRWHPYAVDPQVDYSSEPTTLVTFSLEDAAEGTLLTVVESGFDAIPAHRRDEAVRMNDGGWAEQMLNVERHVSTPR
ncbi:MAG TPA: SRPBCC family protein, partial [Thermoanaerobaculia bacterium]